MDKFNDLLHFTIKLIAWSVLDGTLVLFGAPQAMAISRNRFARILSHNVTHSRQYWASEFLAGAQNDGVQCTEIFPSCWCFLRYIHIYRHPQERRRQQRQQQKEHLSTHLFTVKCWCSWRLGIVMQCQKIWKYPLLLSLSTPLYFHVFSSDFYDFSNIILLICFKSTMLLFTSKRWYSDASCIHTMSINSCVCERQKEWTLNKKIIRITRERLGKKGSKVILRIM